MTAFKKTLVNLNRFDYLAPPWFGTPEELHSLEAPITTIKVSVTTDVTENCIFLLITNEETETPVVDFKIPFDIITENRAIGDQTLWTIKDEFLKSWASPGSDVYRQVLTQNDVINIGATTLITKDSTIIKQEYNNYYSPIRIFVPSKSSTVADVTVIFVGGYDIPEDSRHHTALVHNPVPTQVVESWIELLDTITITGPATVNEDEVVDLNVTCSNTSVTEIFVEPVIGSVNKTRIFLDNGQGVLKVNTFGLSSGDEINIKFGYKYFTGISRYTKTVS
jgi:hypothetical protein